MRWEGRVYGGRGCQGEVERWVGWRETEWSRFIRESRIGYGVYDRSQKGREESGGKRKERLWIGSYAGLPSVPLAEVEIELEWRWRGEGEGWYGVWVGCLALVREIWVVVVV